MTSSEGRLWTSSNTPAGSIAPARSAELSIAHAAAASMDGMNGTQDDAAPTRLWENERRYLTILLSDIVGSVDLSTRLDPEELGDVIKAHYEAWEAIIAGYGGFLARFTGDGVLAYFGHPVAHEDDAERAAQAALEIVRAAQNPRRVAAVPVRVGVATGLVVVGGRIGRQEEPAFGLTPNLAERLQKIAAPNSVVISDDTRCLIGAKFECEELGLTELKGVVAPVRAWRLLGARPLSRFAARAADERAPIVGRSRELAILRECWSSVRQGQGRIVWLSGEPGIGKSRLAEAFLAEVEPAFCVLRYQCSPYRTNTAFHPIIEEFECSAGISREDAAAARMGKLQALLDRLPGGGEELIPLFSRLLSLPTSERYPGYELDASDFRKRIIDGLNRRLLLLSRDAPVVLLFEDVQWSDPSTQSFLATLIERISSSPIFALVTGRNDFAPAWTADPAVTSIEVGRLDRSSASQLASLASGRNQLPDGTVAQVVDRAGCVPLFLEEFARWFSGHPGAGTSAATGAGSAAAATTAIPNTLQELLMSQLDGLGTAKPIVQLGAVIGRTFPLWLLVRLRGSDAATVQAELAAAERAGIVGHEQRGSEIAYAFRHELIRDAAYESISKAYRQKLHERIAQIIAVEALTSRDLAPEVIAYHYRAAGLSGLAAPFWLEAGQAAIRESAHREARASIENGLRCLEDMPDSVERARLELRLWAVLGQAMVTISGHASAEVLHAFSRADALRQSLHDDAELFPVVWGLTAYHFLKGDMRAHLGHSARLLQLAQASGDSGHLIVAQTSRMLSLYCAGKFEEARRHLDAVRTGYIMEKHGHLARSYSYDRRMVACQFGTWALWKLGFPDQAAELEQELNDHSRRLGHPASLAQALTAGASVYMLRREPERLLQRVTEGIGVAEAHGYPVWIDHAGFWIGWALAEQGKTAEGIGQLRRALVAYRRNGAAASLPKFLGLLADRLGEAGEIAEGLALLDQALDRIQQCGEAANEAETYRLRAKLRMTGSRADRAAAQADLERALAIARAQDAKGWELRVATTLARLRLEDGERAQGRALLEPVYAWFSEGLDTPDLQDAGRLLSALE